MQLESSVKRLFKFSFLSWTAPSTHSTHQHPVTQHSLRLPELQSFICADTYLPLHTQSGQHLHVLKSCPNQLPRSWGPFRRCVRSPHWPSPPWTQRKIETEHRRLWTHPISIPNQQQHCMLLKHWVFLQNECFEHLWHLITPNASANPGVIIYKERKEKRRITSR